MTDEIVLPEEYLLETATTIKRFEYSLLGNELKKQTDIAGKEYQMLEKFYSLIFWSIKGNKNAKNSLIIKENIAKPLTKKNYIKQNLIYNTTSFFGYCDDKMKYLYLLSFRADLEKISIKPTNLGKKTEKVLDIVSNLYIDQFEKYYDEYEELFDAKHSLETLGLKTIKIDIFFDKKILKLVKNKNQKTKR